MYNNIKNIKPYVIKELNSKLVIDEKSIINDVSFNDTQMILSGSLDENKNIKVLDIYFDETFFSSVKIIDKKIKIHLPLKYFEKFNKMSVSYRYLEQDVKINITKIIKDQIKDYFNPDLNYSFVDNNLILNNRPYSRVETVGYIDRINSQQVVGWLVNNFINIMLRY